MTPWLQAFRTGIASGAAASTLSSAVLAARARQEAGSPYAGTNAVSHALWGDRAFRADAPSLKYTVAGYMIHHGASMLWATLYERYASGPDGRRSASRALGVGAAVAALAFVVDYTVTPPRFRPGYEQRISPRSMAMVYVALALGLALRDVLSAGPAGRPMGAQAPGAHRSPTRLPGTGGRVSGPGPAPAPATSVRGARAAASP
jgi:hypothetical protein